MEGVPVESALTSILKHLKVYYLKMHMVLFHANTDWKNVSGKGYLL